MMPRVEYSICQFPVRLNLCEEKMVEATRPDKYRELSDRVGDKIYAVTCKRIKA